MMWYDDKRTILHVARYKNAYAAWRDGNEAGKKGWEVKETTQAPARVAVGRTIARGIMTAGIGLLKGWPHKGGTVTVTYIRSAGRPLGKTSRELPT